jgi:hypothetical protein
VIQNIRSIFFIIFCISFLPSCTHFPSDSFSEEYTKGDLIAFDRGSTISIKVNSYANWHDSAMMNGLVADTFKENFIKKGINVKILSENDPLPESYIEIVSIVDNSADDEYRQFSLLSFFSSLWGAFTFLIAPIISTDYEVLVKINRFEYGQVASSHMYSSYMYQMVGLSMIPYVNSDDVGDDIAFIVDNITQDYLGLNQDD